jgi:hypothetical protein
MRTLSAAERQRSNAFDRFVEITHDALRSPSVIRHLGDTAVQLDAIADHFFLPDIRQGVARVPRSLDELEKKVALIPLSPDEIDTAHALIDSIASTYVESTYLPAHRYSEAHGQIVDLLAVVRDTPPPPERETDELGESVGASTTVTSLLNYSARGPHYKRSIPIIMIPDVYAAPDTQLIAASNLVHETVHVWDIHRTGPLTITPEGRVSTELRAYEVNGIILEALGDPDNLPDTTHLTVSRLQQEYGLPYSPYTATPRLIDMFELYGVI